MAYNEKHLVKLADLKALGTKQKEVADALAARVDTLENVGSQANVLEGVKVFLSTPSARRATAKTETKSLFSNKLYNILHEFRRALIYNGSKSYPNHAK